jgi:hypothetical protein
MLHSSLHAVTSFCCCFLSLRFKSQHPVLKHLQSKTMFHTHTRETVNFFLLLIPLAPQPSLGLGLLRKIRLNFLEASQQFYFYRVGLLAPRPTSIPEGQASVFISPRGRVATHFSRLLRHAWVTVGLFLFPGHHTGTLMFCIFLDSELNGGKISDFNLLFMPSWLFSTDVWSLSQFRRNF